MYHLKKVLLGVFIFLAHSLCAQNFSGGFNFNLPPFDATSRQFLPEFPAQPITASLRVSANINGKFYAAGAPIRFWGVNVAASSCFPEKSQAPGIAARMRKMGINLVRFHHVDNPGWGNTIFQNAANNTRTINLVNLDKLEYFIAQLKANGIYVNMNLNVGRTFRPADGVPAADSLPDFGKGFTLFDPWMRFLQKEYAQQILGHVNPYTGLTLAADPVLAMVETNNENSLYGFWRADELRPYFQGGRLPMVYNQRLDSLWTAFLNQKYGNSSRKMADAWAAGIVPAGFAEMLNNGGFDSGNPPTGWQMQTFGGATGSIVSDASVKTAGAASAKLRLIKLGTQNPHLTYSQEGFSVKKDSAYTLFFKAKTSGAAKNLTVVVQRGNAPNTVYKTQTFQITSAWQTFEVVVLPSETNNGQVRVSFQPQAVGHFWFDEASFRPLWQCPPPQILNNQVVNGGFENGTQNWALETHNGAAANFSTTTNNPQSGSFAGQLQVTNVTGTGWHIQFKNVGSSVQKDTTYHVEWWARAASGTPTISLTVMRDNAPYTWYSGTSITLSTTWQRFVFTFTAPENNVGNVRLSISPEQNLGTFFFDNLKLGKLSGSGLQVGEILQNASVKRMVYSQRGNFTQNRTSDNAEFITWVEKSHLNEMRNFLKNQLGVLAPVTGSNSLVGHQDSWRHADMDYIDDHAYWDHPQFPGVPWDGWNWFINNNSMLKSQWMEAITNVTCGLQMQKKPYTISEYNHGFPNRFRTEMVPTLAAYAGFHGVDGIMFYDYNGTNNWTSDFVDGFFDIHRDHSVMALFPSAALAYRKGYIAESTSPIQIGYNTNWLYRTTQKDNGHIWGKYTAYDKRLGLTHSIRTKDFASATDPDFSTLPPVPTGNVVTTSNNQTQVNTQTGIITTTTAKYCSIAGFLNDAPNTLAGDLRLVSGTGFGAVTWVSVTDQSLRTSTRSLVTVSTRLQNNNMIWNGNGTVNNNWGSAPTAMQPISVTLRLRSNAPTIRVYPLDETGLEVGAGTLYSPVSSGWFEITLNQNTQNTLWWGIQANFANKMTTTEALSALQITNNQLKIYPNPAAAGSAVQLEFTISSDKNDVADHSKPVQIHIFDMAGRLVRQFDGGILPAGEHQLNLSLPDLPAGIYSCRVVAGNWVGLEKLIVE